MHLQQRLFLGVWGPVLLLADLLRWLGATGAYRLGQWVGMSRTNPHPQQDHLEPMAHRPSQGGPPDLDEVFRDWKKKLEKMLGEMSKDKKPHSAGSGGGNGGNNINLTPFFGIIMGGASVLVVAIWLLSGLYVVDSNERAVVMQFGRFTHISDPGLNWRMPYPFQGHEIVNFSGVRNLEISGQPVSGSRLNNDNARALGAQMLTGDENVLLVHYTVQYDVQQADYFVLNDVTPDATARLAAETAMREVVGNSTLDKVLYEDREVVAKNAREIMQIILDRYKIGIRIIRVNLQSVRPPEQVQAAFDDAIKASQDRQRQVNEGEAYAQDVVPRARGAASRLTEQAEGYRASVVSRAEGEASRFSQIYQQYKDARTVTRERLYLDAMADVLARSKKIVIDPNSRAIINLATPSQAQTNPIVIDEVRADVKTVKTPSQETMVDRLLNRNAQ